MFNQQRQLIVVGLLYIAALGYLLFRLSVLTADQAPLPEEVTPTAAPTQKVAQASPTVTPSSTYDNPIMEMHAAPSESFVFINEKYELILVKDDGTTHKISDAVATFDHNARVQKVAYIIGEAWEYGVRNESAAYIYDIETETQTLILEYPSTPIGDLEGRSDKLSGVSFTDDGTRLMVSTLPNFYMFDTTGKQLRVISTGVDVETIDEEGIGGIWNVPGIHFSPSSNSAFFTYGMWESGLDVLFDIDSGEIVETDYGRFIGGGTQIVGWYDDNHILIEEYTFPEGDNSTSTASKVQKDSFKVVEELALPKSISLYGVFGRYVVYANPSWYQDIPRETQVELYAYDTGINAAILVFEHPLYKEGFSSSSRIVTTHLQSDGETLIIELYHPGIENTNIREYYETRIGEPESAKKILTLTQQ